MSNVSIPQVLAQPGFACSFEFFPARDDASEAVLWESIRRIEQVRPAFVSVTYGAGGSTRDRTVRVTGRIARETTLTALAHLTCVGSSVAELRQVVGELSAAGVHNVLALRGDPAGGLGQPWRAHAEGLDHADDLVRLIRTLGSFTVGVAAFPDKHPESACLDQDARVLVEKERAGAQFAITQMVTDVDAYLRLRDLVVQYGGTMPIIPALMPITQYGQLERMTALNGQPLAAEVLSRLEAVRDDAEAVRAEGLRIATEHARRLRSEGAAGIHFITMNRSTATLEVFARLQDA